MSKCNCNCKNGGDVQDFLLPAPGDTADDASYVLGLTHYTCGNVKMLVADSTHPVTANLAVKAVGSPVSLGNNTYCQECLVSGTVTYKPCGCCRPNTEYVTYQCCLPCSGTASPTLSLGDVVCAPQGITYYNGCCKETYPQTNRISITTSINVTSAQALSASSN